MKRITEQSLKEKKPQRKQMLNFKQKDFVRKKIENNAKKTLKESKT